LVRAKERTQVLRSLRKTPCPRVKPFRAILYFYNIGLLTQYLKEEGVETSPDKVVVDTLKEYAKKTGYIDIKDNTVTLTKKGLDECQKPKHDWD
jgi:hypothetical protein